MNIQARSHAVEPLIQELKALLGEHLSVSQAVRDQHGHGESYHETAAPDAVAFARSTEEVSAIVKLAAKYRAPIIPFGTGTSLEGHVAAIHGGITIDLTQMNSVLEVNEGDLDVKVEAGVTREQLNQHIRDRGLFFPIDPGANASIGGMTATRASGTNAVRYGTMRENVLGLTVVLADGSIIHTGGRARKSAAGYDLTRLFVGSEGTLGVITEIRLRVYGIPEAMSAASAGFPTMADAVDTVIQTIQSGIPVARIELLDEVQIDAVNRYSKLDYAVRPTLLFEFHGTEHGVVEQAEMVQAIAHEHGAGDFRWATKPEDRNKLWKARHDAYYAALALRPGCKGWATDVCVPISRLADCILETQKDIAEANLVAPLVGHVGDGNFHLVFVIHPDDPAEMAAAERVNSKMIDRALAMGGTSTGEHGIGYGKIHCLETEHASALEAMRMIKRSFDPENRMNPGKMLRLGNQ